MVTHNFEKVNVYFGNVYFGNRKGRRVRKCAGMNRHAVENARVLQERSSEPPGLESCGGSREAAVEA